MSEHPTAGKWEARQVREARVQRHTQWGVSADDDHANGGCMICFCHGPDAESNARHIAALHNKEQE